MITGPGDVFSAGFDLDELAAAREDEAPHNRIRESTDRFHRAALLDPPRASQRC